MKIIDALDFGKIKENLQQDKIPLGVVDADEEDGWQSVKESLRFVPMTTMPIQLQCILLCRYCSLSLSFPFRQATEEMERLCDILSIAQKQEYMQMQSVAPNNSLPSRNLAMMLVARRQQLRGAAAALFAARDRLTSALDHERSYYSGLAETANR